MLLDFVVVAMEVVHLRLLEPIHYHRGVVFVEVISLIELCLDPRLIGAIFFIGAGESSRSRRSTNVLDPSTWGLACPSLPCFSPFC